MLTVQSHVFMSASEKKQWTMLAIRSGYWVFFSVLHVAKNSRVNKTC